MKFHQLQALLFAVIILLGYSNSIYAHTTVFACEPEWAALAKALGGNKLKIYTATTALQDPHHIQARPSLIAKTRRADMLACTGSELEIGWLPVLLRKSGNGKIQPGREGYFMATEHVALLEKPAVVDRSMGDIHAAGNPHIQFDPYRISQVAQAMAETLGEIDSGNRGFYQQRLHRFLTNWKKAIRRWEQRTQSLRGKSFVAHHQSWIYMAKWLGLKQLATLEPKPGIPPTSSHLAHVLAKVKHNPPDMIIYATYQSSKAARWLSKKTGTPTIAIPFSVSRNETLFQWYNKFITQLLEKSK